MLAWMLQNSSWSRGGIQTYEFSLSSMQQECYNLKGGYKTRLGFLCSRKICKLLICMVLGCDSRTNTVSSIACIISVSLS